MRPWRSRRAPPRGAPPTRPSRGRRGARRRRARGGGGGAGPGGGGARRAGRAILPADADSHAGYVLRATSQVVVEDLTTERRFGSSPLLSSHGVVSSLSVLVHGKERPFGILGAHTPHRREFTIHDAHFLQAIANVLATAIDRARTEAALRSSEEHFRSLIENASDIVTVVGENGVFRY